MPAQTKLSDAPIDVRIKLSSLWASVMFCYLYGDFFGLFKPGRLASLRSATTHFGPVSQTFLLGLSILIAIPCVMVFLSLVLKPNANRGANVVLGLLYSSFMIISMPGAWTFYLFLGLIEIVLTASIAWYAWTWPRQL